VKLFIKWISHVTASISCENNEYVLRLNGGRLDNIHYQQRYYRENK